MTYLIPVKPGNKEATLGFTEFIKNALMLILGYHFGASIKKPTEK
jgi:hypothetical protein